MALRSIKSNPKQPQKNEKEIEKFINQGGSSFGEDDVALEEDPIKKVQLRIFESQLKEIDNIIEKKPRRERVSRHQWIIDAIEEKKQREQS